MGCCSSDNDQKCFCEKCNCSYDKNSCKDGKCPKCGCDTKCV